jgi:hypothetical protein
MAQISASGQLTSRAIGFSGGSSCFVVRHVVTAARRTAAAASVPDAIATPCQANRFGFGQFVFGMHWFCPEGVAANRSAVWPPAPSGNA